VFDLLLIAQDQADLRRNGANQVDQLKLLADQLKLLQDLQEFQRLITASR
jgi:hypothetical protein